MQAFRSTGCFGFRSPLVIDPDTARAWGAARGVSLNNQAIPIRLSAEILRHWPGFGGFARAALEAWLDLLPAA